MAGQTEKVSTLKTHQWSRWLPRFGLRFLLAIVAVAALVSWYGYRECEQDRAVLQLQERGVELRFHTSTEASWVRKKFSPAPPKDVEWVSTRQSKVITDDDLSALGSFSRLQKLFLSGTPINGRCLQGIRENPLLDCVHLESTNVDDEALQFLDRTPNVKILTLTNTQISDAALAFLSNSQKLTQLHLGNTRVTDACVQHLVKLPNLESLALSNTSITDTGLESLLACKSLRRLQIDGTGVTEAGILKLASLPSLEWLVVSMPLLGRAQKHLRHVGVLGRKQGDPVTNW